MRELAALFDVLHLGDEIFFYRRGRRGRRGREGREDRVNIRVREGFVRRFRPLLANIVMFIAPTVVICNCKIWRCLLYPLLEFFALPF